MTFFLDKSQNGRTATKLLRTDFDGLLAGHRKRLLSREKASEGRGRGGCFARGPASDRSKSHHNSCPSRGPSSQVDIDEVPANTGRERAFSRPKKVRKKFYCQRLDFVYGGGVKISCENQTHGDAQLFAHLAAEDKRLHARQEAEMAEAVAAAGPIPAGWTYVGPVRDTYALTRAQRRAGAVPRISGWRASRPAFRTWMFGTRLGEELVTCTTPGVCGEPTFDESTVSRSCNTAILEARAEAATKVIEYDTMYVSEHSCVSERRPRVQYAVHEGVRFAQRWFDGNWGPWTVI